ncbi:hypothetical protein [Streptomyces sp. TLI_105]|uniref:hypothetical protein n=1 Tax=Streptomyces sp. TLI_105 TaxID=1881019 RepID=UPI000896E397|nr:hypothetical protein [Streptomyces sp. TLI_105]SEE21879.1 hypothetical protein SAMN05428939_7764 [Streptomyces sp. TLI_105]
MSRIAELWAAGDVPEWDGLYRADGSAREVEIDSAALSWFDLGAPLDLEELLRGDPEGMTTYGIHPDCFAELPDGSGFVCGGDGAHGSEGFFARLDTDRNLVWVVSMGDSNPFEKVEVHGTAARFFNSLGNSIEIDLTDHDFQL